MAKVPKRLWVSVTKHFIDIQLAKLWLTLFDQLRNFWAAQSQTGPDGLCPTWKHAIQTKVHVLFTTNFPFQSNVILHITGSFKISKQDKIPGPESSTPANYTVTAQSKPDPYILRHCVKQCCICVCLTLFRVFQQLLVCVEWVRIWRNTVKSKVMTWCVSNKNTSTVVFSSKTIIWMKMLWQ